MNRKLKGFSLAELLISLLIISIVLSAAIPTLTKKSSGSEQIWRWSTTPNSAYFGIGAQQTAIIGNDALPEEIKGSFEAFDGNIDGLKFTNSGDKLAIFKQSPSSSEKSHLMNSHISFYTLDDNAAAKKDDYTYVGRLSIDRHNIALGIGSLQSLDPTNDSFLGNNTALGHFTLFRNQKGTFNTAIGEYSLANNKYAKHNTAIGYNAGVLLDKGSTSEDASTNAAMNTAIGSNTLVKSEKGRANTALGYAALYTLTNGIGSTGIGTMSLYNSYGTGNTALGANSCMDFTTGSYNLCLGLEAGNVFNKGERQNRTQFNDLFSVNETSNNLLFIGTIPNDGSVKNNIKISSVPLIFGRMQYDTTKALSRYLGVNTHKFSVNTFNGITEVFKVTAQMGNDGHVPGAEVNGQVDLLVSGYNGTNSYLHFKGDKDTSYINADDGNEANFKNIYFNKDKLKLNFSKSGTGSNLNILSTALKVDLFDNRINIEGNNTARKASIGFASNGDLILSSEKSGNINANTASVIRLNGSSNTLTVSSSGNLNISSISGLVYIGKDGSAMIVNPSAKALDLTTAGYDITMSGLPDSQPTVKNAFVKLNTKITEIWAKISDIRVKNVLGDNKYGLDVIKSLDVKNYTFKNDKTKKVHSGIIAQQLQKVYPDAVFKGDDGYLRIKMDTLFFAMLNAIKDLNTQLQSLTAKVTGLDKRINQLEQENAMLKKQNAEFEKRLERLEKKM